MSENKQKLKCVSQNADTKNLYIFCYKCLNITLLFNLQPTTVSVLVKALKNSTEAVSWLRGFEMFVDNCSRRASCSGVFA